MDSQTERRKGKCLHKMYASGFCIYYICCWCCVICFYATLLSLEGKHGLGINTTSSEQRLYTVTCFICNMSISSGDSIFFK